MVSCEVLRRTAGGCCLPPFTSVAHTGHRTAQVPSLLEPGQEEVTQTHPTQSSFPLVSFPGCSRLVLSRSGASPVPSFPQQSPGPVLLRWLCSASPRREGRVLHRRFLQGSQGRTWGAKRLGFPERPGFPMPVWTSPLPILPCHLEAPVGDGRGWSLLSLLCASTLPGTGATDRHTAVSNFPDVPVPWSPSIPRVTMCSTWDPKLLCRSTNARHPDELAMTLPVYVMSPRQKVAPRGQSHILPPGQPRGRPGPGWVGFWAEALLRALCEVQLQGSQHSSPAGYGERTGGSLLAWQGSGSCVLGGARRWGTVPVEG